MRPEYRILDYVQRWGIAPRLQQQTVASHSFYVALYTAQLCRIIGADNMSRLYCVEYALVHDAREAWESDPPGPAKRSLYDPKKAEAYHARFAEVMGAFYGGMHNAGSFPVKTEHGFDYTVKDIVKIADIIDSMFYLRIEQLRGNSLVAEISFREDDRFLLAIDKLAEIHRNSIRNEVHMGLMSIGTGLALIPAMNDDLAMEEFKKNGI